MTIRTLYLFATVLLLAIGIPAQAQDADVKAPTVEETAPKPAAPAVAPTDAAKTETPATETPATEKTKEPESSDNKNDPNALKAGHSQHGEAFNEGPRQKAYLMEGLGRVRFPATTSNAEAAKFVEQGVAQLHGFWYFEAERSFRQAAALDPDCAIAYWGMAMANKNNTKRAKAFLAEAVKRKDKASRREQLYIEALDAYSKADTKKCKERAVKYTKALERLLYEFPDDLDAKAFLALALWGSRSSGLSISSYLAIDALLGQILLVEPMHPAHHYRIHLWDYEKAEKALPAAARCGQSLPGIAHMWHMPGHIFSKLKRYNDAAWQQEASARVDHAHMMRDQVLPDQIHNFAHNNEWLIRNLNHVGRVRDAIDLAKNMTELPRHPKYNSLRRGSSRYGRTRLFETLTRFEKWDTMIALCDTPYLEATNDAKEQVNRLRHLGRALLRNNNAEEGETALAELRRRHAEKKQAQEKAISTAEEKATKAAYKKTEIDKAVAAAADKTKADGGDDEAIAKASSEAEQQVREKQLKAKKKDIDKAKSAAGRPFNSLIGTLQKAINELEGLQALAAHDAKKALPLLKKAGGVEAMYLAHVRFLAGEKEEAIKDAEKYVTSHKNEVQPLAMLIDLLARAEQPKKARERFEQLRQISGPIDLCSPVFERLSSVASAAGVPQDWRIQLAVKDDIGDRPNLDTLGSFRWQPSPANDWSLTDSSDIPFSLQKFRGKPVVVIFYLGYGCLHCAEQLQAFSPMVEEYKKAGIEMVAISTDDETGLKSSIENYDKGQLAIPLLSNSDLSVFKAYRCYDDFESQPLHGTFLIDGQGLIRWQDISYDPFMDPKFVLAEALRLLTQSGYSQPGHSQPGQADVTVGAE
jgi:peroxiredoxin